jgi:cytochrome c oxidase subunit 2
MGTSAATAAFLAGPALLAETHPVANIFKPLSAPAEAIHEISILALLICTAIFVVVGGLLAYAVVRFRSRPGDDTSEPPQVYGSVQLEMAWTAIPILVVVVLVVATLRTTAAIQNAPLPPDALQIRVVGHQWWWEIEYPGLGIVTANELHVPVSARDRRRPTAIHLESADVIHSFWVPKLAGKVDMIPNRGNFLWLQADEPGYFWGQCAEYCGDSHAVMRFRVIALSPKDFADWVAQQTSPARNVAPKVGETPKAQFASLRTFKQNETGITDKYDIAPLEAWKAKQFPEKGENGALIAQGKALFVSKTCAGCHEVRGHGAAGISGPNLTHIGARSMIAAGLIENNSEQLQRWIHDPGSVKPGNKMAKGYLDNNIKLTNEDEVALVAYLQSLK